MPKYTVISDPQIDGVNVGDVLDQLGDIPYHDLNNNGVFIASDFVENNPTFFQITE